MIHNHVTSGRARMVCYGVLALLALTEAAPHAMAEELPETPEDRLSLALDQLRRRCRRCRWGILIKDLQQGKTLYAKNATIPFNPASNIKLITSAAVLRALGAEHRFSTRLLGRLEGHRVVGGLYLQGSGDPTLGSAHLAELAEQLSQLGVREIEGPLYLDTSYYRGSRDPPGYHRFRSTHPFRAGVGALSLNQNIIRVTVAPAEEVGHRALVTIKAASEYVKITGRVRTSSRRTMVRGRTYKKGLWTGLSISGWIRQGRSPLMFWRRVFHPAQYTGYALIAELEARGIQLRVRRKRKRARLRGAPPGLPELARHDSEELGEIIYQGNKHSNNSVAEHLLLALGAHAYGSPTTFAKGQRAVKDYLQGLGVPRGTYRLENGSGLSRRSHIRPIHLMRVLEDLHQDLTIGPEIVASLPIAGQDGTLRKRFEGSTASGLIRAKTGTLSSISCLSGYAGYKGRRLAFIIFTARVRRLRRVHRIHVAMAESMIHYLQRAEAEGAP